VIAKHVAMRVSRKSDFGELARYITGSQNTSERIGHVSISNCHGDDLSSAIPEIQATQLLNTRSKTDKTFHLIVSFRSGESPSSEVLRLIEEKFCKTLGFEGHQRISATHHDTDNLHLHIAVNKVHPSNHTVHTPFNAYWTIARLCEKLEHEFGLEPDNHVALKRAGDSRAEDMERHAGEQSLKSWIKNDCLPNIPDVKTWAELHVALGDKGVHLRKKGSGLAFSDAKGVQVKASSVSRSYSLSELEKRFGSFEANAAVDEPKHASKTIGYEKRPVSFKIDTTELYAQFTAESQRSAVDRTAILLKQRLIQTAETFSVHEAYKAKRSAIKLIGGDLLSRRILYTLAHKSLKADLKKLQDKHQLERQRIKQKEIQLVWADWLKHKAQQGDEVALASLRSRESRQGLKGNLISGAGNRSQVNGPQPALDLITKKGTIVYRSGDSAIRDDGDHLQVSRGIDRGGIAVALKMAAERYGDVIRVNGSDDFKTRVVAHAVVSRMPITFADPLLEKRRLKLLSTLTANNSNDQSIRRRGNDGSVADARPESTLATVHAGPGLASGRESDAYFGRGTDVQRFAARDDGGRSSNSPERSKPNIGRVGHKPPPERKNRLRNLSQLRMVQFTQRSEVLLPGNVSRDLEQSGTQSVDALRRPLFGSGQLSKSDEAAAAYISEREEKRANGIDIKRHSRYTIGSETLAAFSGIRNVNGVLLALLERESVIEVLPIDAAAAQRLKRLKIGDVVTVTSQGGIRTKGRSI
jgi:hypothetical protein